MEPAAADGSAPVAGGAVKAIPVAKSYYEIISEDTVGDTNDQCTIPYHINTSCPVISCTSPYQHSTPSNTSFNTPCFTPFCLTLSPSDTPQDILRVVVQVMNGMSMTATELQKYLSYWEKYKVTPLAWTRLYMNPLFIPFLAMSC